VKERSLPIGIYFKWLVEIFPVLAKLEKKTFETSSYGVQLRSRPQDLTFRFALNGNYGNFISEIVEGLKEPVVFLDIGANLGLYSLLAGKNPFVQAVHSFEPDPISFMYLTDNVSRNNCDKIKKHNLAIGPENEKCYLTRTVGHSGGASLISNRARLKTHRVKVEIVNHETLNSLITQNDLAIFAKIDVEGFELKVLETLAKTRFFNQIKFFVVEFDDSRGTTSRILDFFRVNGFIETGRSSNSNHFDGFFIKESR